MIKFGEKTKNPIINSVFLYMLLFLPALEGYVYKVLTLIFPFIINVITVDMIVAFIWAVVLFLTCRVWVNECESTGRKNIIVIDKMRIFGVNQLVLPSTKQE